MRRPDINPRNLKSVDSILQKREENPILVSGPRTVTETGFVIPGVVCKDFESYFQFMLPNTATAKVAHPAKDILYRVLSGSGMAQTWVDGEEKQLNLHPGEEIHFKPGIPYRLSNNGTVGMDLLVVNSGKYLARLEVLEPAISSDPADAERAATEIRSQEQVVPQQPFVRNNKAAEQMLALNTERGRVFSPPPPPGFEEAGLQINARARSDREIELEAG